MKEISNETPAFSQSTFNRNLKKYYTFYTGGFILFPARDRACRAIGDVAGLDRLLVLFATIALYAASVAMTRTQDVAEYYVAGRRVPSFFNGMATGADWHERGVLHRHGGHAVPVGI